MLLRLIVLAVAGALAALAQPVVSGNGVQVRDGVGNALESATAAPTGSERGLIVRAAGKISVTGNTNHGASGTAIDPLLAGCLALDHGTNPTAVTANAISRCYANRAGVPWVMAGHPNVVTAQFFWSSAKTDTAIASVSAGAKIVVTRVSVTCSNANTVNTAVRIGFGAATLPGAPADGAAATGILLHHAAVAAGSGVVEGVGAGILGVGADGEDLRITAGDPTSGSCSALVSYYTVES